MTTHIQRFSLDHPHLLESLLATDKLLIIQDLDGVCMGLVRDPLTRTLTRVPLSSVIQGTETMGRTAAALLHQMLHGKPCVGTQVLVPPEAINVQASSLHQPLGNPYVMQALLFQGMGQCAHDVVLTDQRVEAAGTPLAR